MSGRNDTIFAIATPAGRSALQVIRVSGPDATRALNTMAGGIPPPRQATLARITSPRGEALDRGLILFFKAPHSATGEDIAEFHLHGSPALGKRVLEALGLIPGFRLAEPGEFTRRAFFHGKLNLDQVEAIGDIIDADTEMQHRQALNQLDGNLGQLTESWRGRVIALSARLEALIDFADEALPDGLEEDVKGELQLLRNDLEASLSSARRGILNRDGIGIALIGEPNAGKSTLLNALAGDDRAIVSPEAGTTRDLVEVGLDILGVAVRLTDTAGIRQDPGEVEKEGIRRAIDRAGRAEIVLVLVAADHPDPLACYRKLSAAVAGKAPGKASAAEIIPVLTKSDLAGNGTLSGAPLPDWLRVSAIAGDGLEQLDEFLKEKIAALVPLPEPALLTRLRHEEAVTTAHDALERALGQPLATAPELMAEDLRVAATALGRITGRVDVEDLLDHIFSAFCIGK